MSDRHVGLIVPLFSLRSERGWGIGELPDIATTAAWMQDASLDRLMLLPLGTLPEGQTSPYSAISTLGIDPMYIRLDELPEFAGQGGIARLSDRARAGIDEARHGPAVRYDLVREAKSEALRLAFTLFLEGEWRAGTDRARELAAYIEREGWWLDDYALFLALRQRHALVSWRHWPAPLAGRDPSALDQARRELADEVLYHQWTQWTAERQWQVARAVAHACGVALFGDLPFVANGDSPEVWAHAGEFLLDVSAGVPPDAFSDTGQDWGLPTYNWPVIAAGGYAWQRRRAARMAAMFDGLRVDHVIGLFRTYGRPPEGEPYFIPATEDDQIAQGRAIMQIFADTGLTLIAEDLGATPEFVRTVLAELGIPGCRVMRWEREWKVEGQPFIDPAQYPARSAAMTGTHDTEPLVVWWAHASEDERRAFVRMLGGDAADGGLPEWSAELRDRILAAAYRSGSSELFFPIQDVFGWPDRINVPGTVGPHNWTWTLPWPVERLQDEPQARERAGVLRGLAEATGRARR